MPEIAVVGSRKRLFLEFLALLRPPSSVHVTRCGLFEVLKKPAARLPLAIVDVLSLSEPLLGFPEPLCPDPCPIMVVGYEADYEQIIAAYNGGIAPQILDRLNPEYLARIGASLPYLPLTQVQEGVITTRRIHRNLVVRWEQGRLSNRESQVMALACRGASNREIAFDLGISPKTVKNQVTSAFRKMGVRSRIEVMERMIRLDS